MFERYLIASAIALAVDYFCLVLLLESGIEAYLSAAGAYLVGLVVHYGLSREFVFSPGWLGKRRLLESLGFLISGGVGILVTSLVVNVAIEKMAWSVLAAKVLAVAGSFLITYLIRRLVVFRQSGPTPRRRLHG